MASTSTEPTTAPSETPAIALACSGVRTPKPTTTGSGVRALMRVTLRSTAAVSGARVPVIPAMET